MSTYCELYETMGNLDFEDQKKNLMFAALARGDTQLRDLLRLCENVESLLHILTDIDSRHSEENLNREIITLKLMSMLVFLKLGEYLASDADTQQKCDAAIKFVSIFGCDDAVEEMLGP